VVGERGLLGGVIWYTPRPTAAPFFGGNRR